MSTTAPRSHTWRFFRTCGLDQALLTTGSDIENLATLDQKLWTALSCPTRGLRFDAETLALLDTDNDGRIRVPELLDAIDWLAVRLASFDSLLDGSDTVKLDTISTTTPEGKALLVNAKRILSNLGKRKVRYHLSADVTDTAKILRWHSLQRRRHRASRSLRRPGDPADDHRYHHPVRCRDRP